MSDSSPDAVPCLEKSLFKDEGGSLLVVAPEALEESCFSVPAVRALKHGMPHGLLTVLCLDEQVSLWRCVPQVDEVISYVAHSSVRQVGSLLAGLADSFDTAILWELSNASKAIAKQGVSQRLGYAAKGIEKLLTEPVKVKLEEGPRGHRVRYYMNLVECLGVESYIPRNFETAAIIDPPAKLRIALAPSSSFGVTYQWSVENFIALTASLEEEFGAVDWVVVRDSNNLAHQQLCGELESAIGITADKQQEVTIEGNIKLLKGCSGLIASDGHVAHLAAHIGLSATVIFGPNEPEWRRPLGKKNQVVREHVACSPCYLSKCPLDLRCQKRVSVEDVVCAHKRGMSLCA